MARTKDIVYFSACCGYSEKMKTKEKNSEINKTMNSVQVNEKYQIGKSI